MQGSAPGERRGGRQKGTPNKNTMKHAADMAIVQRKVAAVLPRAFQGDALAFLVAIYKDPTQEASMRIDAARAALPYEKPRLAAVEARVREDDHIPLAERLKAYARKDAIAASEGKVVEMGKK